MEVLPKGLSYNIFFDNFFTSFRLLKHLNSNNIRATGTANKAKLTQCPIIAPKKLEKKERGYFEKASSSDNSLIIVGWNDNRPVYLASNHIGTVPEANVRRWDKRLKDFIEVPQPYLFSEYNKGMGGVDRCDQNIAGYRIGIRGKKWVGTLGLVTRHGGPERLDSLQDQ